MDHSHRAAGRAHHRNGKLPVKFISSRHLEHSATLSQTIARGLAPDGGLYVPVSLPLQTAQSLARGLPLPADEKDLPKVARAILNPFFSGDRLQPALDDIARAAFDFPAPLSRIESTPGLEVLELFHGPTAAFKDFGARFLSASLERLRSDADRPLTLLVATSGDTGGAVAAAFHRKPWAQVVVLFPKGQVSPLQQQQLTCWGGNVRSFAVKSNFDHCQRWVKAAFADEKISAARDLSSANSINLGRLLPQAVYYASASLDIKRRTGQRASFIIPSGNLGNAMACVWARDMGLPIHEIILAHNANRTVPDYLETGRWHPRPSIATLASAMDVGAPSNMERLRAQYPTFEILRERVHAISVTDAQIQVRIRTDAAAYGRVWCPHTATAAEAFTRLKPEQRERPWVIVATAHPAKFGETIEPLIGRELEVPKSLQTLRTLPSCFEELDADFENLKRVLLDSESHLV